MQTTTEPKGLAKIWREIKRPFRKPWALLNRMVRGMSRSEYKYYVSELAYHQNVIIGKNDRVHLPSVRFHLAHGCNLKCEYCAHAFQTGIVPKEACVDSFEKWSRKIFPAHIWLYGGEPLLNPDIVEIVMAVKHYFPQSKYDIMTNAVLLPRVSDNDLRFFAANKVRFCISIHLDTEDYRHVLQQSLTRLKQFGIKYSVGNSLYRWQRLYNTDADGVLRPFSSNMKIAYENCTSRHCTVIHDNCLYRCSHLVRTILAIHGGGGGKEWDNRVLTHKPVTLEHSPQEIRDYLLGGAMPECSICPENPLDFVEARQLSIEEIQRIKVTVQQRIREAA